MPYSVCSLVTTSENCLSSITSFFFTMESIVITFSFCFHSISLFRLSSFVTCLSDRSTSLLDFSALTTLRTSFCPTFATLSIFLTQPVEISEM